MRKENLLLSCFQVLHGLQLGNSYKRRHFYSFLKMYTKFIVIENNLHTFEIPYSLFLCLISK